MVRRNGWSRDNDISVRDMRGVVSLAKTNALRFEPARARAGLQVAAGDVMSVGFQEKRKRGHAYAAYAYEMDARHQFWMVLIVGAGGLL